MHAVELLARFQREVRRTSSTFSIFWRSCATLAGGLRAASVYRAAHASRSEGQSRKPHARGGADQAGGDRRIADRSGEPAVGRELGYSGVALKACKGHSEALLMGAAAQKYGMFLCVQDLTCPGLFVPALGQPLRPDANGRGDRRQRPAVLPCRQRRLERAFSRRCSASPTGRWARRCWMAWAWAIESLPADVRLDCVPRPGGGLPCGGLARRAESCAGGCCWG